MSAILPEEIKPAMQGVVPAVVASCSLSGEPNCTVISHVYWVDGEHVALSNQFFSKTTRNVRENPYVSVHLIDPQIFRHWMLELRFERAETAGEVFEVMRMQLDVIASMTGMSAVFRLRSADIYRVLSVVPLDHAFPPLTGDG